MIKDSFKHYLKELAKMFFIYCFSGGVYLMIETLFRGYTFTEMYYLAGFLGIIAMMVNNFMSYDTDYLLQCTIMTAIGTLGEGLTGVFFNSDFHIWDYRGLPGTFFHDQCNVIFVVAWFGVIFIMIPVLDYIEWRIFKFLPDTPPYYMIFGKKVFQFKE